MAPIRARQARESFMVEKNSDVRLSFFLNEIVRKYPLQNGNDTRSGKLFFSRGVKDANSNALNTTVYN